MENGCSCAEKEKGTAVVVKYDREFGFRIKDFPGEEESNHGLGFRVYRDVF